MKIQTWIISIQNCTNHWNTSDGKCPSVLLQQYCFQQNPTEQCHRQFLPLPSWMTGMLTSGLSHTHRAITWRWQKIRMVILISCAVFQILFPIICMWCGRRGEHHFANGMTLWDSATEVLHNKTKKQQLICNSDYIILWLQLLNTLQCFIVRLCHDNTISNVFTRKFLNTVFMPKSLTC